MRSDHVDLQST